MLSPFGRAESPLRPIHTLVHGRDEAHKKCERGKRSSQPNGMGYKAHQRRPCKHACISRTCHGSKSKRGRHFPLISRSPKQSWHYVCCSKADKDEPGQSERSVLRSKQERKATDRRQST